MISNPNTEPHQAPVVTPVILTTWEAEIWRIVILGQPGQMARETSISKITRAKWTGDVAQALECLLCKGKALSSNLILT
jgi:hypothetical protein